MSNSPILNIPGIENGTVDGNTLRWEASTGRWEENSSLVVDDTGNVGIGTATPGQLLQLAGGNPMLVIQDNDSTGATDSQGRLRFTDSAGTVLGQVGYLQGTDGSLIIRSNEVGQSIQLQCDASVLVASCTPAALNVHEGTGVNATLLWRTDLTERARIFATTGGTFILQANSQMTFNTNGGNEAMRITSTGDVGIGTASPSQRLTLENAGSCGVQLNDTSSLEDWVVQSLSGGMRFYDLQRTAERVRINTSGNVLIGTTEDRGLGRVLQAYGTVDGNAPVVAIKSSTLNGAGQHFFQAYSSGATAPTGNGAIVGAGASALQFAAFSDATIKENITPLEGELAKILALKPCSFDFTDREGGGVGFVAQEIWEVYPKDVVLDEESDLLMVAGWSKTEARLVKAIQELHAEVQQLKQQ